MRTDNDPEKLQTRLERASHAVGLTQEYRDLSMRQVFESQQSPDDPTVVMTVMANYALQITKPLIEAVEAHPARMEKASRKTVESTAAAATAETVTRYAQLAEKLGDQIGVNIDTRLDRAEKRRDLGLGLKLIGIVTGVVLVAGVVGWNLGRANVSGIATEWASLAARSDSRTWLTLINANPDVANTIAGNCYAGSPNVWSQQNTQACNVPMWLDKVRAPSAAGSVRSTYSSVTDWLASWNLIALVMVSVLAGLFGAKAVRSFRSLRPIRWLID